MSDNLNSISEDAATKIKAAVDVLDRHSDLYKGGKTVFEQMVLKSIFTGETTSRGLLKDIFVVMSDEELDTIWAAIEAAKIGADPIRTKGPQSSSST